MFFTAEAYFFFLIVVSKCLNWIFAHDQSRKILKCALFCGQSNYCLMCPMYEAVESTTGYQLKDEK
jgi:hypothetical protein